MYIVTSYAMIFVTLFPVSRGWGTLGHETVVYVAQHYVAPSTASWAQGILSDTSSSYLAAYATWADSYRETSAGRFSAPYHFIDANDTPPKSCGVDYDRDCGTEGCVVSAVVNYTQRVQDGRLSQAHAAEALKFLVHFIGDVTQPLHDEAYEVGGNNIGVTFDGVKTNLHHIWDTDMLQKYRNSSASPSLADAQAWATALVAEIESGSYSSQKDDWVKDLDIDDPKTSALAWATDANAQNCLVVLKGGEMAVVEGQELNGTYYQSAIPVFAMQIAKGGYRLAKWLDAIAGE